MAPLLPWILGGLGLTAWWRSSKKKGMTPERRIIYESALKLEKDPANLRKLAGLYEKEGLKNEAMMLRKRASLRELPEDIKAARRAAFKAAMASTNTAAIEKVAAAYDEQGATGAAAALRKRIVALKAAGKTPVVKEVANPPVQTSVQEAEYEPANAVIEEVEATPTPKAETKAEPPKEEPKAEATT